MKRLANRPSCKSIRVSSVWSLATTEFRFTQLLTLKFKAPWRGILKSWKTGTMMMVRSIDSKTLNVTHAVSILVLWILILKIMGLP